MMMTGLLDSSAIILLGRITDAISRREFRHILSELRNLEMTVSSLKLVLKDAEEKQKDHCELSNLLKQIKEEFSKVDDFIEAYECECLRIKVQNQKNNVDEKVHQFSSCFSSNFLVYASKTAAEIKKITNTLDMIEKAMNKFPLVEHGNEHIKHLKSEMTLRTSITGSQVFARLLHLKKGAILSDNVGSIIGRDREKQNIIDELLKVEDDKQKCPTILSIHGDGGMGKTALAKLVYNTHQVFNHFDMRMWVCVSEDFDVDRIRREVLSSATGENIIDVLTGHRLLIRLKRNLVSRRFLLVLDDFGAFDSSRVLELKNIVKMGANGSKILVTTRSEENLNDATTYKIDRLDEKKSIILFEHTFRNRTHKENLSRIQSEVKEKLVSKCGGAPLAIKCLAGLLSSRASDDVEWLNVKDLSDQRIQEVERGGILRALLRLNYNLMPSYLKPCFLCFSLLPKDYVFYSFELIQLWMAQGILHSESKDPEVVGEQYFNELWSRSLLEDVEEHALGYWFKIHSLVHDLAVEQANKEQENLKSLHQLSFVNWNNKNLPSSTCNKIRFLSFPVGDVEPKINGVSLVKCISKFRQLRLLYLCNSSLEEIPTSIGTLKHLRYLDLRGNRRLKRLPESICKLQSLQTLILAFCSELEELPKNIKNLINLRFLWIHTKQASLRKDGIGSLTSLHFLAIGGCRNLTELFEDIDKLNTLQTLIIYDCKSLLTLPKGLESMSSLCNMAIWGCEQLRFTFSLQLLGLQKLILRGLPTFVTLPSWINNSDETLEVLEVGEFPRLRALPLWLSNFWELRILGISNCPRLETCMPNYLKYCEKIEELRITFCGFLSKKNIEERNHETLNVTHIPSIYVDSKKIKPLLPSKDEHEAAGRAKQTEEVEHGMGNCDHESYFDHVGSRHDGVIHELIGSQHDGVVEDDRVWAGQTGEGKHDEASNDSHLEIGQIVSTTPSHVEAVQSIREKQDGLIDDSHVGIGQTIGVKLGVVDDCHVETEQAVGGKEHGATDYSHVGTGQTIRAKHDGGMDDSKVSVGQTVGVTVDGVVDSSHVGAVQSIGAEHDDGNGDNHVRTRDILREKRYGVIHDSYISVGKSTRVKQDEIAKDSDVGAEQNRGAKQDGIIGDKYIGVGQTIGAKHDGATNDSHVDVRQTIGVKQDGVVDDSHVSVGQIGGAKHDGGTNNKQVEAEKIERAKVGGGKNNGHSRVCLGDDDHVGAEPTYITTFEGFE